MFNGTIGLVGDLRRCLNSDETCLDDVATDLAGTDVRLGNLEGAFASNWDEELAYKPGWFHGQPEMAKCLVGLFDMVGCANNVHHGDVIVESASTLDSLGIRHAGSGANLEEAHEPAVVDVKGSLVGLLSYTSVFEPVGHAATENAPGVATIRGFTAYEPNPRVLQMPGAPAITRTWADGEQLGRACEDVRQLGARVDLVVVYLHFGVSGSRIVHEYQREITHALIDAGATIVAGSHSHTLGGVEFYGSGVAFYSLGNFIFNMGFHPQMTHDGALAKVTIRDGKIARCVVAPTFRGDDAHVRVVDAKSGEGARIARMIREGSAELGTVSSLDGTELLLTP